MNQFMAQTSAYMARTDRFIQKTDVFMDRTEMKLQNYDATLKSLKTQVGQISQLLSSRQIGVFPSDTEVAKGATHEKCNAITTRSGKILKNNKEGTAVNPPPAIDTPAEADAPAQEDEDQSIPLPTMGENSAESLSAQTDKPVEIRPPPPFPQRLKKQKKDYQFKKFLDILKQVYINLPLVEALQQMPNYAKFLKDMVTRKKRIEEFETAAVTETCRALMHNKLRSQLQRIEARQLQFQEETKVFNQSLVKFLCFQFPSAAVFFAQPSSAPPQPNLSAAAQPSANTSVEAGATEEVHFSSDYENEVFDWQSPRDHLQPIGPTPSKPVVAVYILSAAPTPATSAITERPTPDSPARRKGKATADRSFGRTILSSSEDEEPEQRPAKRQRRYHVITTDSDDDISAKLLVAQPEKSADPSLSNTF
ncbi:hypothetical protein GQ457_12G012000 [Hibiscus cannabinus]